MYCPRCGTWAPDTDTTCASCGAALAPPAPAVAAATHGPAPASAAVAPALAVPAAPRYGGFWRRVASSTVDGLIFAFPSAILRVLAGLPMGLTLRPLDDRDMGRALMVSLLCWVGSWLYCALLESSGAQGTLGQQLLGLQVTDLSGRRISFGRASGRFFSQLLTLLICGVGYLFNLWTSRRQTLHDMIAGCVLVRPEPAMRSAAMPGWSGTRP